MLSWQNSPLLVMLELVDPDVLSGNEGTPLQEGEARKTLLRNLADLADPFDYSTHENQLILAKQLIEHSANVNAVPTPQGKTPLHNACLNAEDSIVF
jgi:ankyrin repeat protein